MSAQHTPLPWKAVTPCPGQCCWNIVPASFDESAFEDENWQERITLPEMSEADAKFIVQCVNAHDELVSVATRAQQFIDGFRDDDTQEGVRNLLGDLQAAIAKATGSAS